MQRMRVASCLATIAMLAIPIHTAGALDCPVSVGECPDCQGGSNVTVNNLPGGVVQVQVKACAPGIPGGIGCNTAVETLVDGSTRKVTSTEGNCEVSAKPADGETWGTVNDCEDRVITCE